MEQAGVQYVHTDNAQLSAVRRDGTTLTNIALQDGSVHTSKVFIDGTYEGERHASDCCMTSCLGDLMAGSGATYTWGREPSSQYNESFAGRREPYSRMDWAPMSPYADDGETLLPLITEEYAAAYGSGDDKVQGYNFRLCVTKNKSNSVPFPKPETYNRSDWALLFKYAATAQAYGPVLKSYLNNIAPVPNGKYDMNNGGIISTDCTGCSWGYPNGTYEERERIREHHVQYQQAFLWTVANDPAIPKAVRDSLNEYGLCKDEFETNKNWPEQLYIREARRLVGDTVLTQTDVQSKPSYGIRSIGMGSYAFDGHYSHRGPCLPNPDRQGCRMLTKDDPPLTPEQKRNSSIVWTGGEGYPGPNKAIYEFPYSILVPRIKEVTNLLLPTTPSTTHVSFATVRMEPQFMILGHSSGNVLLLLIAHSPQGLPQPLLRGRIHQCKTLICKSFIPNC